MLARQFELHEVRPDVLQIYDWNDLANNYFNRSDFRPENIWAFNDARVRYIRSSVTSFASVDSYWTKAEYNHDKNVLRYDQRKDWLEWLLRKLNNEYK